MNWQLILGAVLAGAGYVGSLIVANKKLKAENAKLKDGVASDKITTEVNAESRDQLVNDLKQRLPPGNAPINPKT